MRYCIESLNELKIISNNYSVISFDLFNTLIFRKEENYTQREHEICKLMSEFLKNHGFDTSENELYYLRNLSFRKFRNKLDMELDYSKYINYIASYFAIYDQEIIQELSQIEVKYECTQVYPNPEAIEILKYLKDNNKTIIAVSDMYLHTKDIKKILEKCGLLLFFDNIYVSSDCGQETKYSGRLFQYIQKRYPSYEYILIHIGDNSHSDFEMPLAFQISSCKYNNRKNEKRKTAPYSPYNKTILNAILNIKKLPVKENISQAMALFVKKIGQAIVQYGSKKVYLMTRDADFLEPVLKKYCEMNHLTVEIKILHLDRIHSFFLNFSSVDDFIQNLFIFKTDSEQLTLRQLISKLHLSTDFLEKYASLEIMYDVDLKYLLSSDILKNFILDVIDIKKSNCIKYLQNLDFFTTDNIQVIDIGYSATAGRELDRYIYDNGIKTGRIDFFLFASNKYLINNAALCHEPIYIHDALIMPFIMDYPIFSLNYSWLEPLTLNSRYGPLEDYLGSQVIRPHTDKTPVYEELDLINEIVKSIDKCEEFCRLSLYRFALFPTKQDIKFYLNLTHCKNYDNSVEEGIILKYAHLNLMEYLNAICRDDCWLGGSLIYSNKKRVIKKIIVGKYLSE